MGNSKAWGDARPFDSWLGVVIMVSVLQHERWRLEREDTCTSGEPYIKNEIAIIKNEIYEIAQETQFNAHQKKSYT